MNTQMKKTLITLAALTALVGCQQKEQQTLAPTTLTDSNNLKLVSWNIEHLADEIGKGCKPRSQADYQALANYAATLNADIIALQEISDQSAFNDLINSLNENNWVGFRNSSSNYGELSYLINTTNIEIIHPPYTILEDQDYYFAYRLPYVEVRALVVV